MGARLYDADGFQCPGFGTAAEAAVKARARGMLT